MELDASRLPDGSVLDADLCIVGAGPAGIALAREFIGHGLSVLLLESGGRNSEEWPQTLNIGAVHGDDVTGLRTSRHRQVGGTASRWNTPADGVSGAKYVPLDPWDFDPPRSGLPTGWPIRHDVLDPFYRRAQTACRLGPFQYEARDWASPRRAPLTMSGDAFATRIYQFGSGRPFTAIYPGEIRESANVRLCLHATVCRLAHDGRGERIVEARVGTPNGRWHTVRAETFVLAGGAIEVPRLLLVSGLGNALVGRCFMEHPRDNALTLVPASPEIFTHAGFYDAHAAADGTIVGGRLALSERSVRERGHPNASLTLLPRLRVAAPARGVLGRVGRRLREIAAPPPREGYGWSNRSKPARFFDAFRILVNFEQRPSPDNRVTLGRERDALGMPRAALHWRWRTEEKEGVARLRSFLKASLESAGLGRVEIESTLPIDPNAHHHAGTTRMAENPGNGVVDPEGRVHGSRNLFVAGAAVFPTVGFANPTLTVVALALRLADHLKARGSG